MNTNEILVKARALIDTPEKWNKGSMALTERGMRAAYFDQDAHCFCIAGALMRVCDPEGNGGVNHDGGPLQRARSAVYRGMRLRRVREGSIEQFNDRGTTTHGEVMLVLDAAIASTDEE